MFAVRAVGWPSKNVCRDRKRMMCAGLKLQGMSFNGNRLRTCNVRLVQVRPLTLPSTSNFASRRPGPLAHGHLRLNPKCNAGDEHG